MYISVCVPQQVTPQETRILCNHLAAPLYIPNELNDIITQYNKVGKRRLCQLVPDAIKIWTKSIYIPKVISERIEMFADYGTYREKMKLHKKGVKVSDNAIYLIVKQKCKTM